MINLMSNGPIAADALDATMTSGREILKKAGCKEVYPPLLTHGPSNPLVPGFDILLDGTVWHLSQDARPYLFAALSNYEAVFTIASSFRNQANGLNRLNEFHYMQCVLGKPVQELEALSRSIVKGVAISLNKIGATVTEGEWLESRPNIAEMEFSDFVAPLGRRKIEITIEKEIELINLHGARSIFVRNYPCKLKPAVSDSKIVKTKYGPSIKGYSLLLPNVGSVLDASEVETERYKLSRQIHKSSALEIIKNRGVNTKNVGNYIDVVYSSGKSHISILGVGLERLIQGLTGKSNIGSIPSFGMYLDGLSRPVA